MVAVQLQLVGRRRDRLTARELENIDEVLVRDLGELAALVRVEVEVFDIERGGGKAALTHTVADSMRVRRVRVIPDVCFSKRDRCVVSSSSFKTRIEGAKHLKAIAVNEFMALHYILVFLLMRGPTNVTADFMFWNRGCIDHT